MPGPGLRRRRSDHERAPVCSKNLPIHVVKQSSNDPVKQSAGIKMVAGRKTGHSNSPLRRKSRNFGFTSRLLTGSSQPILRRLTARFAPQNRYCRHCKAPFSALNRPEPPWEYPLRHDRITRAARHWVTLWIGPQIGPRHASSGKRGPVACCDRIAPPSAMVLHSVAVPGHGEEWRWIVPAS